MGINGYLVKSTFVSALGGLLFGFDTAVIAGTTHQLSEVYRLTPYLLGMTVSSALWGTVVGAMTAGYPGSGGADATVCELWPFSICCRRWAARSHGIGDR